MRDIPQPFDAVIDYGVDPCPECQSLDTETSRYAEGYSELRCHHCGYDSEAEDISTLARYRGDVLETKRSTLPVPSKTLKA